MATAIPESISALPDVTAGEKRVFKLLKELLPNDYIVWYDLRVNGRYPDFIILGPDLGLVILEVKDWKMGSIKTADNHYFELETMGKKANPQKQARTYMFSVVDELKKDGHLTNKGNLKFTYGHGVIFTRISRKAFSDSSLISTIDDNHILFQDDLKELEDTLNRDYLISKLHSMFPVKFDFNPLSPELIDRVRGRLFKEVNLSSDSDHVMKVMSTNQEQYAKGIGYGHRIIRGVAGSGKTVVLICRAKYLADAHKDWKILVLCYNKVLAAFLKDAINTENVEVWHFHGWVNKTLKSQGFKASFTEKQLTKNISSSDVELLNKEPMYDAILVDEGQDLEQEWLKFTVQMLRDPENSHLLLTSDGAQNLYNRKYTLKSVGIKAAGRTTIMKENYRNTKEIIDFAHNFLMDDHDFESHDFESNDFFIEPDTTLRSGLTPVLCYCSNFEEELNKITDEIKRIHKNGVSYQDICVLYPQGISKDVNYLQTMELAFEKHCIPYFSMSKNSNSKSKFKVNDKSVKLSSIHSSKGLDFKYVFIIGLNDKMIDYGYYRSKKLLYVGMTRARDYLFITYCVNNKITDSLVKVHKQLNIKEQQIVDKKDSAKTGLFSKIMSIFK